MSFRRPLREDDLCRHKPGGLPEAGYRPLTDTTWLGQTTNTDRRLWDNPPRPVPQNLPNSFCGKNSSTRDSARR